MGVGWPFNETDAGLETGATKRRKVNHETGATN
jgi:hypothetical protein